MRLAGRWRIVSMELWEADAIDLVEPGFIEFHGRSGRFGFIAVEGQLDCRETVRTGGPAWSSPGKGRTTVTPPPDVVGPFWPTTTFLTGVSSSTWGMTRASRPCAPSPPQAP